jgi:hypothetical protein
LTIHSRIIISTPIFASSQPTVSLHLNFLALADVNTFYSMLDLAGSPDSVANIFHAIMARRPPKGHLIVELNKGEVNGPCFFPKDLVRKLQSRCTAVSHMFCISGPKENDGQPINLAPYIRKGKNVAKFIQLKDLSGYVYMLYASRLPPIPQKAISGRSGEHLKCFSSLARDVNTPEVALDDNGWLGDIKQRFMKTKLNTVVSVMPGMCL